MCLNPQSILLRTVAILVVTTALYLLSWTHCHAADGTQVSGIIASDTTWSIADSPIEIVGHVQITPSASLTVAAGVEVVSSGDSAYKELFGSNLYVLGTTKSLTKLNNIDIRSDSDVSNDVRIEHAEISCDSIDAGDRGRLDIRNSLIDCRRIRVRRSEVTIEKTVFLDTGLGGEADITIHDSQFLCTNKYPQDSCYVGLTGGRTRNLSIENTYFDGSGIFAVGPSVSVSNVVVNGSSLNFDGCTFSLTDSTFIGLRTFQVTGSEGESQIMRNVIWKASPLRILQTEHTVRIENNLFYSGAPMQKNVSPWDATIFVGKAEEVIIVRYNTFADQQSLALGYDSDPGVGMSAENCYWGTEDIDQISGRIYDANNDLHVPKAISFSPILAEVHPGTPLYLQVLLPAIRGNY